MKDQVIRMLLILLLGITNAQAITWGEVDGEAHPYVGLIVFDDQEGPAHRCSGTLISPTVVLTAAHCTYGMVAARIWFESNVDNVDDYPLGGNTGIGGTPFTNPEFDGSFNPPNNHDVGIVVLEREVTDRGYGVLLPKGVLDDLAIRRGLQETYFTPVGYGLQGVVPDLLADRVRYHATSMLVSLRSALTDGYNIQASNNPGSGNGSGGTCFGDSGGPLFLHDTNQIAAVSSFVLNQNCVGAGFAYRVDIDESIDFIKQFL